ncbi:hypothetical protein BGZ65_004504 [Modicella reniformis]|uniref:Histidine-specific methyltransferase SAM-dependent domain-containing protein n=1 Tax=Modicella reniformis TaxID=1440133 RepID=A0A9P6M8V2_9FUNG|nr:hypothetical protein BGZ65_004504 [Modicella reniformis]
MALRDNGKLSKSVVERLIQDLEKDTDVMAMAADILGGQAVWSKDEERTLSGALTDPSSLTEDTVLDSHRRYSRLPMALRFLHDILEKDEWDSDFSLSTSAGTPSSNDMIPSMNLAQLILEGLTPEEPGRLKSIPRFVFHKYDDIYEEGWISDWNKDAIANSIQDNSIVVEVEPLSWKMTKTLLRALDQNCRNIKYYVLSPVVDVMAESLESLGDLKNVKTTVLHGSIEEGLAFIRSLEPEVPKTIAWLSLSTSGHTREEIRRLLASYHNALHSGDAWLIGFRTEVPTQENRMYKQDNMELDRVNQLLEQPLFDFDAFEYHETYNKEEERHEASYKVKNAHQLTDPGTGRETTVDLAKDELIHAKLTYVWSPYEMERLFEKTELIKVEHWTGKNPWSESRCYDLHLVSKTTERRE